MKKIFLISFSVMALASCNKISNVEGNGFDREIVLNVADEIDMEVSTKVTEVTTIPSSLYWSATTGALGSETTKWASASATVSSNKISTGKQQTATATSYNYYVSNNAITFAAGGSTVVAENTKDVIAGKATSNGTSVSVTLNHVFARTGSLTLNTQTGYEIVGTPTWKIKSNSGAGTKGTYNIAMDTWSSLTALSEQAFTGSSDLYLVPGSYTVSCTYTLKKGDYQKEFTKSATVTLVKGKINNITATAVGGDASDITLTLTLTAWSNNAITATFN